MADREHLERLRRAIGGGADGIAEWNAWRESSGTLRPSLRGAQLDGADLRTINLDGANLNRAQLRGAKLTKAMLRGVHLNQADLRDANLDGCNLFKADLGYSKLQGAKLRKAEANFVELGGAHLEGAKLKRADLRNAGLNFAHLEGADLRRVDLRWGRLIQADLRRAKLMRARLNGTNLQGANLSNAKLQGADLSQAILLGAKLNNANLRGCRVYGVCAWDMELEGAKQAGLVVSDPDNATITVDAIEVAQFVYLLLNNAKIKSVIHSVTAKAVLILGRFTAERLAVLEALRAELRGHDLVPILFDFEPSSSRDITEHVQLLANMSKFVIADLTDAKCVPQELSHIIPFFPSVPVRPIILRGKEPYAMFEHWQRYDSVLPIYEYRDQAHLLDTVEMGILRPIERWKDEIGKRAAAERELEALRGKLRELETSDPEQHAKLMQLGIV